MRNYYKEIVYNVFCNSVYDSDVVECNSLEKAEQTAKEWSQSSRCEVIVERVETEYVKSFKGGKQL